MEKDHIVLLRGLSTPTIKTGTLYYYQGNFYYPLEVVGADRGLVKRAIREFRRVHGDLVAKDRAHPDYKSLVELFDN